ncbi:RIC1-domain-containing protein [Crepidotus variabilis]|uniref:RIC1-domain-containing protein n=1 Tax=Crepidotus variabilis TaxID=179855 RepID=A0A9P6E745_9AGAR|nr:RIC1-domain-containing protein [Crepidotus variabilis]
MYFPTASARRLITTPELPNIPSAPLLAVVPSPRKLLFCTVTRSCVCVWSVRPSAQLALLTRTPTSILNHGDNVSAWWSPDGNRLVIKTSDSYLVLVSVLYSASETVYNLPPLPTNTQRNFLAGAGEGMPFHAVSLQFEGVIRVEGSLQSVSPRKHHVMFSTQTPPTIQQMPWPVGEDDEEESVLYNTWVFNEHETEFNWLVDPDVSVTQIVSSKTLNGEAWITSDGRAYLVSLQGDLEADMPSEEDAPFSEPNTPAKFESSPYHIQQQWLGTCIHDFQTPKWVQKQRQVEPSSPTSSSFNTASSSLAGSTVNSSAQSLASSTTSLSSLAPKQPRVYIEPRRATSIALNPKFSLVAVGTFSGALHFTNLPSEMGVVPKSQLLEIPYSSTGSGNSTGQVKCMEWSSDGYVLAVGWESAWGIFSVGGKCLAFGAGAGEGVDEDKFQDIFMYGVKDLFWGPGNFELFILAANTTLPQQQDGQLFVIPFAKSATTGQHSPDNTRYAFLQLDDRALIYRGADQPDLSVINPESDVWQHIKIPQRYLALNWPIRYSSLSSDGRLIAIAGRRGLIHYSSSSGRWKIFADEAQEQNFSVRGGLLWFHHVLIAAVEVARSYQIRLYSRDLELTSQNVLHREMLQAPVVILSIVDNSLLAYTADNTLHHYLIVPTAESIKLHLCGSITFSGIISAPSAVRMLSWMIPSLQKQIGDPVDDLAVATVLMVVGGQLILLRPRKEANADEVKYDIQVLAERIEFCWIHLRGVGALENSLWGYDAKGIRVWLNALNLEAHQQVSGGELVEDVKESVRIPLDFYPLSVLMDKGIIIGVEHELAVRSNLPFVLFRHSTSSHLFLQHILLYHLENKQINEAVAFASHYKNLVFFSHALEILLHTVVESDFALAREEGEDIATLPGAVLPTLVEFLDHFDACLDVVVGCARKTELTRWRYLFNVVGNPKGLFETCLSFKRLKTAGSYLLVLHNLEQLDENSSEAVRLLNSAVEAREWQLCRELLRFLHSIDDTGQALQNVLSKVESLADIMK